MSVDPAARAEHEQWLVEVTSIPTATGCEARVIAWIEDWVQRRDDLALERDACGNLTVSSSRLRAIGGSPLYFTAHLDHPAFVVEQVLTPTTVVCAFRGGVMAPYFNDARVQFHLAGGVRATGRILEHRPAAPPERLFRECVIELTGDDRSPEIAVGDFATWDLPPARIVDGHLEAPACDDLSTVAASLAALDELSRSDDASCDTRLLFTLAEEVGFIGAVAACRDQTMPRDARVIALENSRSFADSPLGGGPIVRVGDRMSIFSPTLTRAVGKVAEKLGHVEEKNPGEGENAPIPDFKWQRKLMAGGACEASAYCAWGYEATCVCLPLGNYHNMAELERVQPATQSGESNISAEVAPERISVDDYHGLVDLLIGCGKSLGDIEPIAQRLEKLYEERKFVLD